MRGLTKKVEASSKEKISEIGMQALASVQQYSEKLPPILYYRISEAFMKATLFPMSYSPNPSPAATTVPEPSQPGVYG